MKKAIALLLCILIMPLVVYAEVDEVTFVFTKAGGFEGKPDNDIIKQEIEKRANIKLNHIAPPIANYDEKVNIILSSNDLPDLVKLRKAKFNDMYDYAEQGALFDLAPYLDEYLPHVKEVVPEKALDLCRVGDGLYGIPVWSSPERMNFIVRGDWLDNLGLEVPTTLDELHDVMYAFTYNDPDGNGIDDTYGLTARQIEGFEPIFGAYGFTGVAHNYWYLDDQGRLKPSALHENAKECLELLNAWYNEGLIDPEFVILKNESEINDKAMKNQWGFYYNWWTFEPKIEAIMREVDPEVRFDRIAPPIGPYGDSGVRGVGIQNGVVIMLANAKNPEACLRLLDWLHTEDGMMTMYAGVQDVHWVRKEDGTYYSTQQYQDDIKWIQYYSVFEPEPVLLKLENDYLVQSRRDAFKWKTITNDADGLVTEAELRYGTELNDFVCGMYSNFITGKRSLSEWDDFVQEFYGLGGEIWENELNEVYRAKMG